jgi:hypothetical protein
VLGLPWRWVGPRCGSRVRAAGISDARTPIGSGRCLRSGGLRPHTNSNRPRWRNRGRRRHHLWRSGRCECAQEATQQARGGDTQGAPDDTANDRLLLQRGEPRLFVLRAMHQNRRGCGRRLQGGVTRAEPSRVCCRWHGTASCRRLSGTDPPAAASFVTARGIWQPAVMSRSAHELQVPVGLCMIDLLLQLAESVIAHWPSPLVASAPSSAGAKLSADRPERRMFTAHRIAIRTKSAQHPIERPVRHRSQGGKDSPCHVGHAS